MKYRYVFVALVCSFIFLAGCFKAQEKSYTFRLAETHVIDYSTTKADIEFARLVKEGTKGRIDITVHADKVLGEEKAVIEQVTLGSIDFARVSLSVTASFVPVLDALQLPYLYRDSTHMWKVLNGPVGEDLLKKLEASGLIGLCYYDGGTRSFYTKKLVKTAAELKGLKIRVQQSPLMVGMIESLGAVAIPMAYGEVYSALDTGVVDGAENNWPSYFSTLHYEPAPFYLVDEHTKVPELLIMSKNVFDKLSKADQALVRKAAKDSVDFQVNLWKQEELNAEKAVKEKGATVTTVSPEEKQKFMDAMKPLYDKQSEEIKELAAKIRDVK